MTKPAEARGEQAPEQGTLLLSPVPGGCGRLLHYFRDDEELTRANGPIWCGMALRSVEGQYVVCPECYLP